MRPWPGLNTYSTRPSSGPLSASQRIDATATAVLDNAFGRAKHHADEAKSEHMKTNEWKSSRRTICDPRD